MIDCRADSRRFSLGRFEWSILLLIAVALCCQLIIPPIVGLADNGDFQRVTGPLGLTHTSEIDVDTYLGFVDRKYRRVAPGYWGFVSSESLFVIVALGVSALLSKDGLFDIVTMGAVHGVSFLCALGLVLGAARAFRRSVRYAFGALLLAVTTDVAYISYFNSFYMAPAALIFLCFTIGSALMAMRGRRALVWLVAYFVSACLFVASMTQNVPLSIFFAAFGLLIAWGRICGRRRIAAVAMALGLCALSPVMYHVGSPRGYKDLILWDSVFFNLLPNSPDERADLRELGLPEEWAEYSGRSGLIDPGVLPFEELRRRLGGTGRVLRFYARHPGRRYAHFRRCLERGLLLRVSYLGNFEKASGRPRGALSRTFAMWSDLRTSLLPGSHRVLFLGLFFVFIFAGALFELIRARRLGSSVLMPTFVVTLAALAVTQFLVVAFTAGAAALIKGLWLFNFLCDTLLVVGALWGVDVLARLWGRVTVREGAAP